MTSQTTHSYRVVCSSGDAFFTKAESASDYILDPVFIQFIVLCTFMFTSLTMAIDLPLIPQILLFGAGVVTTFALLALAIKLYLLIIGVFGGQTIYTPLLLVPMQAGNMLFLNYVLHLLGTTGEDGFVDLWQIAIRTFIIIICLDIMHARFVAPQHRMTVSYGPDGPEAAKEAAPSQPPATNTRTMTRPGPQPILTEQSYASPEIASLMVPTVDDAVPTPPRPEPARQITIGRETVDLKTIQYIKSEDHYLVLQKADQTEMIRGKLKDVAAQIEQDWGLQINRSVWVSYAAINSVQEAEKGQLTVQMSDGFSIKVANSRKLVFEQGCSQFAPSLTW